MNVKNGCYVLSVILGLSEKLLGVLKTVIDETKQIFQELLHWENV